MRLILAVLSLVLAVVLLGSGIAQRTVLRGPDTLSVQSVASGDAVATVIDGSTLGSLDGRQDIRISGAGPVLAVAARTTDVIAWLGDASYNRVEFDPAAQELRTVTVEGTETAVPAPQGSDLWLREYPADTELDLELTLDDDLSIVAFSDGTAPAPSTVAITWLVDNSTPLVGPLVVGGLVSLALSFLLFLSVIVSRSRRGGPGGRAPNGRDAGRLTGSPRPRAVSAKQRALTSVAVPVSPARSRRRRGAALPVLVLGSLLLAGCSSDMWPAPGAASVPGSPSPVASDSGESVDDRPPVATPEQVERIVADVVETAATADTTLDAAALESRFTGPALDLRKGNFAVRAKDPALSSANVTIPAGDVAISLPERSDTWPRSIFAVTQNPADATSAPVALVLEQASPREDYKVVYSFSLEPNAALPTLPPEETGTARLSPDTKLLTMQPDQLLPAYLDVMANGPASSSYGLFDIEKDLLLETSGVERLTARKVEADASNSILEAAFEATGSETFAFATNDAGALVTAAVTEKETSRPKEGFEAVPSATDAALSGVAKTAKGIETTYGDQMLFYIPPIGSTEKTVLLGYSQGVITAKELP